MMAVSQVMQLMRQYLQGQVTAEDVVAQVVNPPQSQPSVEEIRREDAGDYVQPTPANTWDDVNRFWYSLTPTQQQELEQARRRRFGF